MTTTERRDKLLEEITQLDGTSRQLEVQLRMSTERGVFLRGAVAVLNDLMADEAISTGEEQKNGS